MKEKDCKNPLATIGYNLKIRPCPLSFPLSLQLWYSNNALDKGKSAYTQSLNVQAISHWAYPGFCSIKWLGWDISTSPVDGMLHVVHHSRVIPHIKFTDTPLYTWVERGTVRVIKVSCPRTKMSPSRAQTWTAQFRVKCPNHEATAPPP